MPEVHLTRNAEQDLRRIGPGPERTRLITALKALGTDAANLDTKALIGAKPWLRLRTGDYRLLYWQRPDDAYEVARIVHRRDLDAAVPTLPDAESEG